MPHPVTFSSFASTRQGPNWTSQGIHTLKVLVDEWLPTVLAHIKLNKQSYPTGHANRDVCKKAKLSLSNFQGALDASIAAKPDQAVPPAGITRFAVKLDTAYVLFTNTPDLTPPAGCSLYWTEGKPPEYIFISSQLRLDQWDVNSLYEAMFDTKSRQHQSTKVTGAPANMLWYVHQYGRNRLLAVTGCNPGARTIDVPVAGKVNDGKHEF